MEIILFRSKFGDISPKKREQRTATAKGAFLLGCYRPPGKTRLEVPPLGDMSCPSKAIKLTGTRNIFCPESNDILPILYAIHYNAQKKNQNFFQSLVNSCHHKFQMRDAEHTFKQKLSLGTMIPNLVFLRGEMILALW